MDLKALANQINTVHDEYQRQMALGRKYKLMAGLDLLRFSEAGYALTDLLSGPHCPDVETAKEHMKAAKRYLRNEAISLPDALKRVNSEIKQLGGVAHE